ncbi:MAG: hypothetical protein GY750_08975 [Lentisphaerae bacterium]|nr:hypothetical protein [Lentisphaerota bacterium]MCP4101543.1 hypothetical protein [Lentisphaerota bacterium]
MDRVKMPATVNGEWIWKKSLLNKNDCFLIARKELTLDQGGQEADLWISANCAYQLFVNDRLVGFGPRANSDSTLSNVDQYNLSYYLQQGTNLIYAIVYYAAPLKKRRDLKVPGLWCQLNLNGEPKIWSDRSWKVCDGECFISPRARQADNLGLAEFLDLNKFPSGLDLEAPALDSSWIVPDYITPCKETDSKLEIYPLSPNTVEEDYSFEAVSLGTYNQSCALTHMDFNSIFKKEGVHAAAAFVFNESSVTIPLEIIADDSYKLFCNNTLVKKAHKQTCAIRNGERTQLDLRLKGGWNRLLILQEVTENSMGIMLVFPNMKEKDLRLFQDTIEDAPLAWNIAGPLKMPLSEATPSISFERLDSNTFKPTFDNAVDVSSCLRNYTFEETDNNPVMELTKGQYLLLKMDALKYGFPNLEIEASKGDIIDITIGHYIDEKGFPSCAHGIKSTHTIICKQGINRFIKFKPEEVCYIMITGRKIKTKINVFQFVFEEFTRFQRSATSFHCSDEELNNIWEVGCNAIQRGNSYICQEDPRSFDGTCLADLYFHSCNTVAAFGDNYFSEVKLTKFAEAQFENGNIPAMSFDGLIHSQVTHLFLLSVWVTFHHKNSGNDSFLQKMLPHVDLVFEFFESLLDEETGVLKDFDRVFHFDCPINNSATDKRGICTDINSLYCRFLLSAGEIYREARRPETQAKCFRMASEIARKIKKINWHKEAHSFSNNDLVPDDFTDAFSNFIALYSGVTQTKEFENIFYRYFNFNEPFSKVPEQSNDLYFHFLFMETVFAMDQAQWGLRYLKDFWSSRIDENAMAWKINPEGSEISMMDFYHGSSVCPNVFLLREAVGVRVAEPGYSTIYFNPAIDSLDWAEAIMPTSYGRLKVRWEKLEDGSLDVTIDAKFPLKVLPEMDSELIQNTTFRLGQNVALLDPESVP